MWCIVSARILLITAKTFKLANKYHEVLMCLITHMLLASLCTVSNLYLTSDDLYQHA